MSTRLRAILPLVVVAVLTVAVPSAGLTASGVPVELVKRALTAEDARQREDAVRALAELSLDDDDPLVAPLSSALKDRHPDVRIAAAEGLGGLELDDPAPVLTALTAAFADPEWRVQAAAAEAIGTLDEVPGIAVPALVRLLRTASRGEVRAAAASALGEFSSEAQDAVHDLVLALGDSNETVAGAALQALHDIGPAAHDALAVVLSELDKPESRLPIDDLSDAADSIDPGTTAPIEPLRRALASPKDVTRMLATHRLARFGDRALPAIPDLAGRLLDKSPIVRRGAAEAVAALGDHAQVAHPQVLLALSQYGGQDEKLRNALLKILLATSADLVRQGFGQTYAELDRNLALVTDSVQAVQRLPKSPGQAAIVEAIQKHADDLRTLRGRRWNELLLDWALRYPWALAAAAYVTLAGGVSLALLWAAPLWILAINEGLPAKIDVKLPDWLGGVTFGLRSLLAVGFFHYHPRVLEAWVARHIERATEELLRKPTVAGRAMYIEMPLVLDGKTLTGLAAPELGAVFERGRFCLAIRGEGGAGKTTLACQLAVRAASHGPDRLCRSRMMLPLFLEEDPFIGEADVEKALIQAVRGELAGVIGAPRPVPMGLLVHLLRDRRLLVMLDGLSEMSLSGQRRGLRVNRPGLDINALVVTSRVDDGLVGVSPVVMQPLRVEGNRLSSFLEAYLQKVGGRDLFDDATFFEACRRLSLMVGTRDVTLLLARLYADQLLASRAGGVGGGMAQNVPDMILAYLNEINRHAGPGDLDDRSVHKAAKEIAWLCVGRSLRPLPAQRAEVLGALGGASHADATLRYLEEDLGVLRTIGPAKDRVCFVIDPIAEYLAALHVVEECGAHDGRWQAFLSRARSFRAEESRGFLLAVSACCDARAVEITVPAFVHDAICELGGEPACPKPVDGLLGCAPGEEALALDQKG